MMANRHRGEISAMLDGEERVLCLTLGALAELETAFEVENLGSLLARFSSGNLAARDLLRILTAGLRGGGATVTEADVARMKAEGGVTGFAKIASHLLTVTFGAKETRPNP
ncbi:MAG: gene transfer agent family protein [Phyllobacterium sp.]